MNDHSQNPFDADLDGFPLPETGALSQGGEALERLATDYVSQVRRGEFPTTDEMISGHPDLAEELKGLLPIAQALEQWKAQKEADCLRQNRPQDLQITQLGDFEIIRELGRGGMGVVFEARQGAWNRRVAVKMLPWRFGDAMPRWKTRFKEEAKTIAQLRHRHIVPVYSFGEHDGYCYYVMQLVEGLSLDRILANLSQGPSEPIAAVNSLAKRMAANHWPSLARIGAEVTSALEHAHDWGVLHNDIKPANLLVDATGHILVTDFSTHRLQTEFPQQAERATGTYRYMAPERLTGASDQRSDVYSLGVTLYELSTRQPAFSGKERSEMLGKIARADFIPPRKLQRQIPWDWEAIILKCMALDPADRYQSARELRQDLMRFLHGQPISIPKPGLHRQFFNWLRTSLRSTK